MKKKSEKRKVIKRCRVLQHLCSNRTIRKNFLPSPREKKILRAGARIRNFGLGLYKFSGQMIGASFNNRILKSKKEMPIKLQCVHLSSIKKIY